MPRHFRPVGGFADRSISAVKIDDDGHSHHIFADGNEAPAEYIADKVNVARPVWSLGELENLVRAGRWEEFTPDAQTESQPESAAQPGPIESTASETAILPAVAEQAPPESPQLDASDAT
jgi:hypothetical protein